MNKKKIREWIVAFCQACVLVFILYIFCWPVNIEGPSMEKTFYTGDRVAISKLAVIRRSLEAGDFVICTIQNRGTKEHIIKRVIAITGDHVVIKNEKVMVNDTVLIEAYANGATYGDVDMVIPDGHIYILGDNRENSLDSRTLGAIPYSKVSGKVLFRFFPFKQAKIF